METQHVLLSVAAFGLLLTASLVTSQRQPNELQMSSSGYRLEHDPTYMIIAPNRIYPNMVLQISVSVYKLYFDSLTVRASVRREGFEYASFTERFTIPTTKLVQMWIPEHAQPGNYTLKIEGSTLGSNTGNIFENETKIMFSTKQASMFIQTNKPLYKQGQTVFFRVVPVYPNLMPVFGSMDVYVVDPTDTIVRRWLSMQTNAGVLDMKMELSDQPKYGQWKIQVRGYGHTYEKKFWVEEFWLPRFFVNVSMPSYIMEDTFGIAGLVTANHTSGRPVRGNTRITLEVRPALKEIDPNRKQKYPTMTRDVVFFEGRTDFLFTMEEIKDLIGEKVSNHELYVHASVYDWYLQLNETGYAMSVIYGRTVTMRLLGDTSRSFKPGFPVSVYYAVMEADGTPLSGMRRQVTIQRIATTVNGYTRQLPEEKLIVGDDGIVHYHFLTDAEDELIKIRSYYDAVGSRTEEVILHRTYSHYNNYLHIETSTQKPLVNEYMIFTVRSSTWVEKVYYLICSKGNIIVANTLEMASTQKTFSVALSRDMVPSSRIVAYYILNGEVVSDALNFHVNGSMLNPVEVRVNMGKDFLRDTVEITGITDPGSYIAFSGLDYDYFVYDTSTFFDENDIIEELETYDDHANGSFAHKWYFGEMDFEKVYFPAQTYGIDTNRTFAYAGLIVYTDANVTLVPHDCNETLGYFPCHDGSCYEITQICDGTRQCEDGIDEMGCERVTEDPFSPGFHRFKHISRHFEETGEWLWEGYFTKPDGRLDLRRPVPKEPMSWLISAFAVSRDKGLGITRRPTRYQSTRPFFIEVEMPDNTVKGEQIGVRIALFNYWDFALETLVTLHDSEDYRFVVVDDFGIVNSYAPRIARGNIQTMVYLEAGRMTTTYMPVLPVRDGSVNITVSATSFMGKDTVTRSVSIKYDGVTNHYNTPYLIDLINQGSLIIPDFDIPVPEQFIYPEQREHSYVPGSPKATVSIIGDVVGPGFFVPRLNAENLMRRPYGCGEQNMFNFATNLYNIKFLKETNQLGDDTLFDALEYMNLLLQRQTSYMSEEGAFSMFRDYREPTYSTWLTAFVLTTLQDADEADWREFLFIENGLLNKVALWLTQQQDRQTGAFSESAPFYDYNMRDNITFSDGEMQSGQNISLTAYVLIALSNARGLTGVARMAADSARLLASNYLEPFVSRLHDPYQVALVSYALLVAGSNVRNEAFTKLDSIKRVGEYTYWSRQVIPPNPTWVKDTIHYQQPRIIYAQEGSAVSASGYALLVYLANNRMEDATSIMKWLQSVRNSIGGWGSTQDSIMALKALTAYGERDTNRELYNIEVQVQATSMSTNDFDEYVKLNQNNWMQMQNVDIPRVYGQVKAWVRGTGMALIQLHTAMNVEYPHKQYPQPNGTFFNITLDKLYFSGKNFSIMEATACALWTRPDLRERTGMVVMEMDIPTGYVVMNDKLRSYVQSGVVPTLSRAEFYSRKVVFYLDYVDANQKTCVDFRADRWYPIANGTIQHMLKIYDYYEPGMFNYTLYTTYNLFNLHICQVCGSFQCPYCPYYNSAPPLKWLHTLLVTLICLAIAWTTKYVSFT